MAKPSVKIIKLEINEEDDFSGVDAIALVENPAIESNWMYFSDQKFETYADYGERVRANAKNAVEWAEENGWGSCGTGVGKQRAHQLAKGEAISLETIKRMYSYLSRHEGDLESSTSYNEGCGKLMYDAWGGKAALGWSRNKLRELGELEMNADVSGLEPYVNEPSGSLIVKDVFVTPSAGETEDEFISRCIPVVIGEGKDQDQAAAICYSYWEERFENVEETERILDSYVSGLFDLLGFLDGLPVFATPQEASEVAEVAGCEGYHEHQMGDYVVYMPCAEHESSWDEVLQEAYEEWRKSKLKSWNDLSETELEGVLDYLDSVAEVDVVVDQEKFAKPLGTIPNGVRETDRSMKSSVSFLDTPTTKIRYKYNGPVDDKNRDFCRVLMTRYTRQNKVFRKEDINQMSMAGVNTGFGPGGVNQYDIFAYRGGVNCRHTWQEVKYSLVNGVWVDTTMTVAQPTQRQKTGDVDTNSVIGRLLGPNAIGTQFSKQKFEEQQIVAGPLMIPNKLIYRYDELNGEYFVYFSEETIKKIAYKYMQNKYTDNTNLEHMEELSLSDVFVVESWIVSDPDRDKSSIYSNGEKYPKGTWYGMVKVKNKQIWDEYVKTGLVRGFSVEGFFIDELLNKTEKSNFQ
jgi:hypothetical protein